MVHRSRRAWNTRSYSSVSQIPIRHQHGAHTPNLSSSYAHSQTNRNSSPPWNDSIRSTFKRLQRRLNKLCGLPASEVAGILATLIGDLRGQVEARLGGVGSVTRALVATPRLPGLTYDDLNDAMEYVGLELLVTHKHISEIVSETSAAFTGAGLGLCQRYDDLESCGDEEADMPYALILRVSYETCAFSAAYPMKDAYNSFEQSAYIDFALGSQHLPNDGEGRAIY